MAIWDLTPPFWTVGVKNIACCLSAALPALSFCLQASAHILAQTPYLPTLFATAWTKPRGSLREFTVRPWLAFAFWVLMSANATRTQGRPSRLLLFLLLRRRRLSRGSAGLGSCSRASRPAPRSRQQAAAPTSPPCWRSRLLAATRRPPPLPPAPLGAAPSGGGAVPSASTSEAAAAGGR